MAKGPDTTAKGFWKLVHEDACSKLGFADPSASIFALVPTIVAAIVLCKRHWGESVTIGDIWIPVVVIIVFVSCLYAINVVRGAPAVYTKETTRLKAIISEQEADKPQIHLELLDVRYGTSAGNLKALIVQLRVMNQGQATSLFDFLGSMQFDPETSIQVAGIESPLPSSQTDVPAVRTSLVTADNLTLGEDDFLNAMLSTPQQIRRGGELTGWLVFTGFRVPWMHHAATVKVTLRDAFGMRYCANRLPLPRAA